MDTLLFLCDKADHKIHTTFELAEGPVPWATEELARINLELDSNLSGLSTYKVNPVRSPLSIQHGSGPAQSSTDYAMCFLISRWHRNTAIPQNAITSAVITVDLPIEPGSDPIIFGSLGVSMHIRRMQITDIIDDIVFNPNLKQFEIFGKISHRYKLLPFLDNISDISEIVVAYLRHELART